MAKIAKNNTDKNSNKQSKGTMPKDMLLKYKLSGNLKEPGEGKIANIRKAAKSARAISTYRMFVHNAPAKLPACLRNSVHYFLTPMSRVDSDNPRDKKGSEVVDNNTEQNVN